MIHGAAVPEQSFIKGESECEWYLLINDMKSGHSPNYLESRFKIRNVDLALNIERVQKVAAKYQRIFRRINSVNPASGKHECISSLKIPSNVFRRSNDHLEGHHGALGAAITEKSLVLRSTFCP